MLSRKTILNMVALLSAILGAAVKDYELLPANPLDGILDRKHLPVAPHHPRERRARVLEPEDFKRAVATLAALEPKFVPITLTAALAGLRWGELVAVRIDEDIDFRSNHICVTRALYRRIPKRTKTDQSVRDIDMCPTVQRIMKATPRKAGLVFSPDGTMAIGDGTWIKRRWHQAQIDAGITRPVRWHDLRHQYVSLLIHIGKPILYISQQAGHRDPATTLRVYAHLFETVQPAAGIDWLDEYLWPSGCPHIDTSLAHALPTKQATMDDIGRQGGGAERNVRAV